MREHALILTTTYTNSCDVFTVVNTADEPIVGWINNVYGAAGVVAGAAVGLLKSMYCNSDILADIVPVDMVINSAIAIAWDVAEST
jgi:fatty acyl-CoA reductase